MKYSQTVSATDTFFESNVAWMQLYLKIICGNVVYVYIETTTYRSDIQAFILVTCYTDVFTAGKR
jgi:hypothetical protein